MVKNKRWFPVVLLLAVFLSGCGQIYYQRQDVLFQTSTLNALVEAIYDGDVTCGELKKHGDFGIGTFNALDGEMVMLDGKVYQIKSDGIAYPAADSAKTPFAAVKFFKADQSALLNKELDLNQLEKYLDGLSPSQNLFYAIKITGHVSYAKTRSIPRQEKPYPGLVEASKNQKTFEFRDAEGTILALRCPEYAKGFNLPGYHFHFITKDRKAGGHLLECSLKNARIEIDSASRLYLALPENKDFLGADLSGGKDSQVKSVER